MYLKNTKKILSQQSLFNHGSTFIYCSYLHIEHAEIDIDLSSSRTSLKIFYNPPSPNYFLIDFKKIPSNILVESGGVAPHISPWICPYLKKCCSKWKILIELKRYCGPPRTEKPLE